MDEQADDDIGDLFNVQVNRDELDSRLAYIQVTWVKAAPEGLAVASSSTEGSFERAHNVRRFVFETPFTRDGTARGPVHHQRLRLTHLTGEKEEFELNSDKIVYGS